MGTCKNETTYMVSGGSRYKRLHPVPKNTNLIPRFLALAENRSSGHVYGTEHSRSVCLFLESPLRTV